MKINNMNKTQLENMLTNVLYSPDDSTPKTYVDPTLTVMTYKGLEIVPVIIGNVKVFTVDLVEGLKVYKTAQSCKNAIDRSKKKHGNDYYEYQQQNTNLYKKCSTRLS